METVPDDKLLYRIALTQINGVGDIIARHLLEQMGDAEAVFKAKRKELLAVKHISRNLVETILSSDALQKAEKELRFIEKNKLQTFFISDSDYPSRLKECMDAPVLLYYKGNAVLNAPKVISIVGTRKSTSYGDNFCGQFLEQIARHFPDTLIISGLAFGIDCQAHKAALRNRLPTVGVLAHGLDRIYPANHRKMAIDMLEKGGLLTEFTTGADPERYNFVRRNRIVAGLADAVLVIESNIKGGSLITAEIANSYNREVFALPGRTTDPCSKGCNRLITENKAILLESAESFLKQMNWDTDGKKGAKIKQVPLFLALSHDEQNVYDLLYENESMHINLLSSRLQININAIFAILLQMEMRNIIEPLPGGLYKLK